MMTSLFSWVGRISAGAVALGLLVLAAGCAGTDLADPARYGPFYEPQNVAHDLTLGAIRRVLLLPVSGGTVLPPESAADLDPVFRQALQDQNRFEVVTISRREMQRLFGADALSSAAPIPHDFFATVRDRYAADAVLFVDITVYRAYHPLALGIRSRLAVVNSFRLVWSFDNVFSADDPTVSAAARHFFLKSEHQGVPGDLTPAVLQSPGRFAAYAASATFETLPPVVLGKLPQKTAERR